MKRYIPIFALFLAFPVAAQELQTLHPIVVTQQSAILRASATIPGTYEFNVGRTESLGTKVPATLTGGIYAVLLKGLQPGTTYHYALVNKQNETLQSPVQSFTTLPEAVLFTEHLRSGMRESEQILAMQRLFVRLEYLRESEVSGVMDRTTTRALRRFQREYDLPQTGTVGPYTRAKLNELWYVHMSSITPSE